MSQTDYVEFRLGEIEKKVEKHDQDLYRGNGKPGVTTRLQDLETRMTVIEKTVEKVGEDIRQAKNYIIVSCVGTVCTVAAGVLVFLLTKH